MCASSEERITRTSPVFFTSVEMNYQQFCAANDSKFLAGEKLLQAELFRRSCLSIILTTHLNAI
jgi:hypothetical protein